VFIDGGINNYRKIMPNYIITGGPGAGKTSLLKGLQQCGYNGYAEASRQLIIEEKVKGSGCLPWMDLPCFAKKVLERMTNDISAATHAEDKFFDRGIPDIIAYLEAAGLPVEEQYYAAVKRYRYADTVFLLPSWQEIYVQDSERWQTFEEAAVLGEHIRSAYLHAGYRVVELPRSDVPERIRFIQKQLK
jgi:predicted ATPase